MFLIPISTITRNLQLSHPYALNHILCVPSYSFQKVSSGYKPVCISGHGLNPSLFCVVIDMVGWEYNNI